MKGVILSSGSRYAPSPPISDDAHDWSKTIRLFGCNLTCLHPSWIDDKRDDIIPCPSLLVCLYRFYLPSTPTLRHEMLLTSIFKAVLDIEYEAHFGPMSSPILASPDVIFMITFLFPFSRSGRRFWVTRMGPTRLLCKANIKSSTFRSKGLSSPGFYCIMNNTP